MADEDKMDKNPTGLHKFFENIEPEAVPVDFQSDQLLIDDEEQYALWPAKPDVSVGQPSYFKSSQQACLDHVKLGLTDLPPKSIRD